MRKYWKTAVDGSFGTSSNWSPAGVPGGGDLVFIPPGPVFPYTVTTSTNETVLGISLGANATLDITNSSFFMATAGTATGTNLGFINVEAGSQFAFGGVLNNQNTINLIGVGATGAHVFLSGDTTLKGGGNFFLSDTSNNGVRGFDTLTNVDNLIEGAGTIQTEIVNKAHGTIEASSGSNKLLVFFSNVTNTGMLLGAGTAGLELEGGIITNIGGTIQANAGCFVYLEEGTKVIGGRLNTITNGDIVVHRAVFDGSGTHAITNDGNLDVQAPSFTGDGLYTQGVIINHHGISITGATMFLGLPSSPGMDTTFQGGGQVALSNGTIDLCSTTTLSKPLTLNNLDNVVSGDGTIGSQATGASLVLNNGSLGIINATGNNKALVIYGNVVNSHLMEGTGGGALGLFGNLVTNTAGTIRADTNSFVSVKGTIKGGRLEGAGIVELIGGATLDGSTTPLTNAGNVDFGSESFATLKGTINNTGNIEVSIPSGGTGGGTVLVMAPAGSPSQMTLKGGGTLTLDLSGTDFIDGTGSATPTTFVNVDNTIKGAGKIGDRGLILKNGGTVNATGGFNNDGSSLVIDTESRIVTNTGTMKATGGTLYIASPLSNTGVLIADNGFSLVAAQGATGGIAKLDHGGQIEFGRPTTTAVNFEDNSASSLVLDDSVHFKGVISNFGKLNINQSIDLLDIDPLTATKTFAAGSPNVLTVKDAAGHTAQLKFSGTYTAANFNLSNDGHGGTLIKDPPGQASPQSPLSNPVASLFGQFMASWNPITALASEVHSPLASEFQTAINLLHAHG